MAGIEAPALRDTIRQWYPIGLIYFAVGLATAMAAPFLTLFLTTGVRADPVHVTIYLVVAPLSSVTVSTLLGRLSDRWSIRRKLVITAAITGCVSSALFSVVRDYWVLLILVATATATAGCLVPQIFAYARAAMRGSNRSAMAISSLRTLFSVAWVAGPPCAALVLAAGGFTAVYLFAAAMYASAALIAIRWLPEQGRATADPTAAGTVTKAEDAPRRVILLTQAAFLMLQSASSLSVQLVSVYVTHDLHGDVRDSGLILGLCAGLEIPLMLGLGMMAARVPLRRLLLAGPVFAVAYFSFAAVTTHTWELAVAQILNACGIAAIQGLGISYFQDLLPRHPGRASTLFSNGFPTGAMLAGPILGTAAHVGYRFGYAAAATLSAIGLVLLLVNRPPAIRKAVAPVEEMMPESVAVAV
jgi:SET family sugar efflux transporter-like MFS transporter